MSKIKKRKWNHFCWFLMAMLVWVYQPSYALSDEAAPIQKRTLKGRVTDEQGIPLAGVQVVVNTDTGSVGGVLTDFEGRYKVTLDDETVQVSFSYVGFKTQVFKIGDQTEIDVVLKEDATKIDEVVLVGYGSQSRESIGGAVASIKGKPLEESMAVSTTFDQSLHGMVKGVQLLQSSGRPGDGAVINIRGNTAPFNTGNEAAPDYPDNQPLFVIDGVPFYRNVRNNYRVDQEAVPQENPLSSIDPNDIESIDILKDASATAIYGSRGANGVIIVKTKRGKGEMKVMVRSSIAVANRIKDYDFLNAREYKEFTQKTIQDMVNMANTSSYRARSLQRAVGQMANFSTNASGDLVYEGAKDDFYEDNDTDWQKEVYRGNSVTYNIGATVQGGINETGSYLLSFGRNKQEGVLKGDLYDKYAFRGFIANDIIKDRLKLETSVNLSRINNLSGNGSGAYSELATRPTVGVEDDEGNPLREPTYNNGSLSGSKPNVLDRAKASLFDNKALNVLGNVALTANLFDGFSSKIELSGSRFRTDSRNFKKSSQQNWGLGSNRPLATLIQTDNTVTNLTFNWMNSYSFAIEKHHFLTMVGLSWDRNYSRRDYGQYQGFPDDDELTTKTYAESTIRKFDKSFDVGLNGLFTRILYDYDQAVFFNFVLRRDQSSRFGPDNQSAYFPSASVSLDGLKLGLPIPKVFSQLKLRTAWGQTGSNNVKGFAERQFFEAPTDNTGGRYNGNPTVQAENILPNKNLKWAVTTDVNVGLDLGFFNNRLTTTLDVYIRKTKGALMNGLFPFESGASRHIANFADLTNRGFEFDISGAIIRSKDFTWNASFNIARNVNTLDDFASLENSFTRFFYKKGKEPNFIAGYKVVKIYQTQAEIDADNAAAVAKGHARYDRADAKPGDYKYEDINGDGKIDREDRTYLGSSQPDFFGGFSSDLRYKQFNLSFLFNYSVGAERDMKDMIVYADLNRNITRPFTDRWTTTNTDARYSRITTGANNSLTNERTVFDASYLRLKRITLAYGLPRQLLKKLRLSSFTLSLSATNLWTLTDYPGLDPEAVSGSVPGSGSGGSGSAADTFYPTAKEWVFALNFSF